MDVQAYWPCSKLVAKAIHFRFQQDMGYDNFKSGTDISHKMKITLYHCLLKCEMGLHTDRQSKKSDKKNNVKLLCLIFTFRQNEMTLILLNMTF